MDHEATVFMLNEIKNNKARLKLLSNYDQEFVRCIALAVKDSDNVTLGQFKHLQRVYAKATVEG